MSFDTVWGYTLDLHYCLSARAKGLVRSGVVELAFTYRYDLQTDSELKCIPFVQETLYLICDRGDPLVGRDGVRIEELSDRDFILPDNKSAHTGSYISMCRHAGFEPKIAAYSGIETNMLRMVKSGLGVAFVYVVIALSQHSPRYWRKPQRRQAWEKADRARGGG